ncbi:DNA cytosine methyltransferase [Halomonas shantousis]
MFKFYEFFAGAGMARAGLGKDWQCLFANDFDHKKGKTYQSNWEGDAMVVEDIKKLTTKGLPGYADLAWASFPCQDLSLAGGGAGLKGDRSGTFWPFWKLMTSLQDEGRAPTVVALENVCGTITSHKGKDFTAICEAFNEAGYRYGAMVIDASLFVPQSRPRLFVVGVKKGAKIPSSVISESPHDTWHTKALRKAYTCLSEPLQKNWVWWNFPLPPQRTTVFADIVEENPASIDWHSDEVTRNLLAMMSEVNLRKVEAAKLAKRKMVGTVYKRTRRDAEGNKIQRAEVRFDDVAGCLRTPSGGSSRQLLLFVEGESVRSRLISTRETARLMGLSDDYALPERYNEAYHLTGDGVAVPVVRHIAQNIIEKILELNTENSEAA